MLFGLSLAPATQAPADRVLGLYTVERQVIDQMNAERAARGLWPLRVDLHLVASARRHNGWMARTGNLVHTSANVGENIAMGQRDYLEAVRDWMNSPGHRANMLSRGYTRVGASAYRAPSGTIFWCLQFLN
jgi:uncharacterized protein YkwD